MTKGHINQSRDLRSGPPEIRTSSEAIAAESSVRPSSKVRLFLRKVKNGVIKKSSVGRDTKRHCDKAEIVHKLSNSKDSGSRDHVLPNIDCEGASLTSNIEIQDVPSGVEQGTDPQLVDTAVRNARDAADQMNTRSGPTSPVVSAGQNAPADLDKADNVEATYLKPLRIFDSVIGTLVDVHPYAKMALGVLSCASKIVLAQVYRDEAVLNLLKKLGQVYSFMTEDKTLHQISSIRTILGDISQQTFECARFIKYYSETKNFWERLKKNVLAETNDTIQRYNDALDALMQNARDQVVRDVAIVIHRIDDELNLSGITYAAGAGLDTRKRCLSGTRTDILSKVMRWINDSRDDVPRVLWLSGPAGTGKSAIAHTIASSFIGVGGLGSCYCFDRNTDHRHDKVFSTIARDLADRNLEMRRALADAVQNANALKTTVDIVQQWQKLLMEPLGKLSESTVGPVVIVIDALDESGKAVKTRSDLLRILSGKLQDAAVPKITELPKNFRIIVTSRPLRDIEAAFADAQHIERISMDDIPPATAEGDIYTYVSTKLEGLSDFGSREFEALATKADGLFEWARLACESIEAPPAGFSPMDSFNNVVSRDPAKREHLLYDMYDFMLTEIMRQDKYANAEFQETRLARFRSVMGQILGAAEPLPSESLNVMRSHFPDQKEHYKVEVVVEHMGSLLSGTTSSSTPIRLLHASFRDFLTDRSCSGDFFIDVSKVQRNIAFASLRVMQHDLSLNICDLKSSYLPNSEDTELPERIQRCIPPHLSYSCRFWPAHIRKTSFDAELAQEVKLFFDHERLLFWLEVLALIDALSSAAAALPLVAQWLKSHDEYKDVSSAAIDVQRFIQVFGSIMLHSTPHLYVSALPFSPANSAISRKFVAKFPNILHLVSGRDVKWPVVQNVLSGHTDSVNSVSFSPDGTRIVTGSDDTTVRLWDAATGQPVGEPFCGHTDWVRSVSFSPDGTRIVSGSEDKTVRLWDAATGHPVGEPLEGHTASVYSVSFSPNGTHIVSGSKDKTVRLWDAATGQPVGEPLEEHTGSVHSVSFSLNGTRMVTGSNDHTIRLWDVATWQPIGEPLEGHIESDSVSLSPDGTRIATASKDNAVLLWDAVTGQSVGEPLLGHTSSVTSVSFSPDGTRIATGSNDNTVRLWDTATGQPVGEALLGHTSSVTSVSFSPDGIRIATGSNDKTVRLWDAATGQLVGEPLRGRTDLVHSVSLSQDGTCIATGSTDGTVRLWDVASGKPVGEPFCGHTGWVCSISLSPHGIRIATRFVDDSVRLWDAATGQPVGEPLRGHTDWVRSVSFSPDGTRVATGSDDKTVRLWDAVTGQQVGGPLRGHIAPVYSVSFSPDGTHIATGSDDMTVRLWDAATGQPVGEPLRGHTSSVTSVSFSPDGTRIVSGSKDKTIRLWDVATGQPVGELLLGHTDPINSVAFSLDGTRIASGSTDDTVRLWDTVTGQPVGDPLRGHTGSVCSVSFSPDGTRIVSGSLDQTVRVWRAAVEQPLQDPAAKDCSAFSSHSSCTRHPAEATPTITPNHVNDDFIISFSSNPTHSLYNAAELIEGTSYDDRRSTSFSLGPDGWMLGPNRRLLFWVPPASREAFSYNPRTALVILKGCVELDLSHMAHGTRWQRCRDATL